MHWQAQPHVPSVYVPPAQPPPPTGAVPADYGRYCAETPSERFARVLARPPERLFCMECVCTYSLDPSATPTAGAKGLGDP